MIDAGVGYQMFESVYYLFQLFIIGPLLIVSARSVETILTILAADFIAIIVLAIFSAVVARRLVILLSLPYFYVLRCIELAVFIWAFIEVILLRRFNSKTHGWRTEGRRYEIASTSLKDIR